MTMEQEVASFAPTLTPLLCYGVLSFGWEAIVLLRKIGITCIAAFLDDAFLQVSSTHHRLCSGCREV